jgi:hypothetical protein
MAKLGMWLAIVGGVVAVVGQFYWANYYLPAIGGVLAVVGGFMK